MSDKKLKTPIGEPTKEEISDLKFLCFSNNCTMTELIKKIIPEALDKANGTTTVMKAGSK